MKKECVTCYWFDTQRGQEPCASCEDHEGHLTNWRYFRFWESDPPEIEDGEAATPGAITVRLVTPALCEAVAKVRAYEEDRAEGDEIKQPGADEWLDEIDRRFELYLAGYRLDESSRLPHLWHMARAIGELIVLGL